MRGTASWKKIISNNLVIIATVFGLELLAEGIIEPILPLYLTSIDIAPKILGLMLSVGWLGMIISESFWGWTADKIGAKIPLSIGTFISGLMVFCFVLVRGVPNFFTIFLLWGIARSAIWGPSRGYIGVNIHSSKKTSYMAFLNSIMMASLCLGMLPSGFIVDTWGYPHAFDISCGVSILAGIILVIGLKAIPWMKRQSPAAPHELIEKFSSKGKADGYRPIAILCAVAALLHLGLGISFAFLPLMATQVVGVTAAEVGILFTFFGLSATLAIPIAILADRWSKKPFMIFGLLASASGLTGIAIATNFPWLVAFAIVLGLGYATFNSVALSLLSHKISLRRQSTAMGFYGAIGENTGIMAGAALGGFAWSAWGPQATFLIGPVACTLGIIICLGFVKNKV
jgi:PPP family 3-phenylpropionic acid transporter